MKHSAICKASGRRAKALRFQRLIFLRALAAGQSLPRGGISRLFLLLVVDLPRDALWLLARTFVPEREWLALRYGLEDAPGWRVRLQRQVLLSKSGT